MRRGSGRALLAFLIGAIGVGPVAAPTTAQVPGLERRTTPGRGTPELPLPPAPPGLPPFTLPPAPELPTAPPGPPSGASIFVRAIRLEGESPLPAEDLAAITRRYEGRRLGAEDLLRLRDELTLAHIERGYVNSGAVLPDQDVTGGVVVLRLVEGRLSEVELEGLRSLDPAFLEARIRQSAGPPLDVRTLQERLQLLLLDPAIGRLGARLGPGARPGEGRLEVDVEEAQRFTIDARFANDWSPSIGAENGQIGATFLNLLGRSDALRFEGSLSEGARDAFLAYAVPLTPGDLRFYVSGEVTSSDVVEQPFNQLDIQSSTWSLEFGFLRPVLQRVTDEIRLGLAFARRHAETTLLDEPFSFSPGARDGESDIAVLRFRQDWDHRGRDLAVAFRSTVSLGIGAFGATVNGDAPDSRYLAWLGQVELAQRLFGTDHQLVLRGSLQLASDSLLPLEQIAIGGLDTVRGYREDLLVLDNGYAGSIEYRLPLLRLPVPGLSERPEDGILYLAPFVDIGGGYNNSGTPDPDPRQIASVGAGFRWSPAPGFSVALYAGLPLDDTPSPDERDLQDEGIHFELRARLY